MGTRSTVPIGGRVVLITGAARGIGLAIAKELHARGARLALGDLDEAAVAAVAAGIAPGVASAALDVSDPESFAYFVGHAESELGPVDVLINNAGIMPIGPFEEETPATARRIMEVNVLGCLTGMRLVLPGMLERGGGHIVNVASAAGKGPAPGGLSYCASKAAVVSATETGRAEFGQRGIEFTCVMPSFTATELIAGTKGTRFLKTIEPEEVARAVAGVVERPAADVYLPRALQPMFFAHAILGRRVRDRINRAIGADRTFLDIDQARRQDYDARVVTETAKR